MKDSLSFNAVHLIEFYAILADVYRSSPDPLIFICANKNNPLVDQVDPEEVNPAYAHVHYMDGHQSSVCLRDLVFCPGIPLDIAHTQTPPMQPEGVSQSDAISNMNQTITSPMEGPKPNQNQAL